MAEFRIDVNQVQSSTGSLSGTVAVLAQSHQHILAALALDPSVLVRGDIRGRIVSNAATIWRIQNRIRQIQSTTNWAAGRYAFAEWQVSANAAGQGLKNAPLDTAIALILARLAVLGPVEAGVQAGKLVMSGEKSIATYLAQHPAIYRKLMGISRIAGSDAFSRANAAHTVKTLAGFGIAVSGIASAGLKVWDDVKAGVSVQRTVIDGVVAGGIGAGGAAAGGAVGAAVGSVVPVFGTAVGFGVGVVVGGAVGWAANNKWAGGGRSIADRVGDSVEAEVSVVTGAYNWATGNQSAASRDFANAWARAGDSVKGIGNSSIAVGLFPPLGAFKAVPSLGLGAI